MTTNGIYHLNPFVNVNWFSNYDNKLPQITQLLLGDAIIWSKTDPRNGRKKEKKS